MLAESIRLAEVEVGKKICFAGDDADVVISLDF